MTKNFVFELTCTGTDPGIFVRGVQLSENFDKKKKKKKKKGGGVEKRRVVALFLLAEESIFQTFICIQVCFREGGVGHGKSLSTQIHRFHGRIDIVNVFGMGGMGVLPQKIFSFNGVKSCNSRQEKHENALKVRDWKLDSCHNLDKGKLEKRMTVPY